MTPELYSTPLRSNPELVVLGATKTIKPDYLNQARGMTAPEVWGIEVRFTGTVGAVTGGALGRDAAKVIDTLRFKDDDDVLNVSGAGWRVMEQMDYGQAQIDPTDLSSGTTNSAYRYSMYISFTPTRAKRPKDFAIPLTNFLDGGEFSIQFANAVPTGWAAAQADWAVQLFADVRDGRKVEAKSRRRIKEEALVNQEFDYQGNGYVRAMVMTSKLATTGYTSLAGFSTLNSRTFKWPAAFQTSTLVNLYRREFELGIGANDEFLLAAPGAIPLMVPHRDQKIGCMVDAKTIHLDLLQAAPAGGRIITDTLIDRNPTRQAMLFGYSGVGQYGAAITAKGVVKGAADNYSVAETDKDLARKLPLRIKGH